MKTRAREIEPIDIDAIHVGERMRSISPDRVATLAASMKDIGLLTPISVRYFEKYLIDGREVTGISLLISGATRLAAAKSLGWDMIDCVYLDMDDIDAKLWEIAENLHRSELTVQERAAHVAEWVRLSEQKQSGQVAQKGLGHRPQGGVSAASRELNIERTEVRRAVKIDSITPAAKEAAKSAKIDNNQSALLKVAAAPKEKQVDEVNRLAHMKKRVVASAFTASERRIKAAQDAFLKLARDERRVFMEWIEENEDAVFDSAGCAA